MTDGIEKPRVVCCMQSRACNKYENGTTDVLPPGHDRRNKEDRLFFLVSQSFSIKKECCFTGYIELARQRAALQRTAVQPKRR